MKHTAEQLAGKRKITKDKQKRPFSLPLSIKNERFGSYTPIYITRLLASEFLQIIGRRDTKLHCKSLGKIGR